MREMESYILLIFNKTIYSHSLRENYSDSNKVKKMSIRKQYNVRLHERADSVLGL